MLTLEYEHEKEIQKFAEIDELPSEDEINKTIQHMGTIIQETKGKITVGFDKVFDKLKRENYQDFIRTNFKDLCDFFDNIKKEELEKNILGEKGILSKQNLITLFSKAKQIIIDRSEGIEKKITKENMRQIIDNQKTLKKNLMSLRKNCFVNKIVYSKNLSSKMVHYTDQKLGQNGKSVSNREHYMMYYIIDNNGKMKPLVKNVDDFKQKLKEFEEKLEKEPKVKISGQNFGQEYHSPETIDKLINNKFQDIKKYINEAKGNKNEILGYKQPKGFEGFKQTVDENGNAIINNTKTDINSLHNIDNNIDEIDLKNENYNEQNKEEDKGNNKSNDNSVEETALSINDGGIKPLQKQPQDNPNGQKGNKKKKNEKHNSVYSQYAKEPENEKEPKDNLTNVNKEPEDTKKPEDSFRNITNVDSQLNTSSKEHSNKI